MAKVNVKDETGNVVATVEYNKIQAGLRSFGNHRRTRKSKAGCRK